MAYSRWDRNSNWYVFWEETETGDEAAVAGKSKPKSLEMLDIWRAQNQATPRFSYAEVSEILQTDDFSRIPGFDEDSRAILCECMIAFIRDLDTDHQP